LLRLSIANPDIASPLSRSATRFLLAVIAATGCAGREVERAPVTVRDSAGITIVDNDLSQPLSACAVDSIPSVVIGSADGGADYELHRVFGATRLSDGRIVLVNQGTQQIRYYDSAGRFLRSAGRAGEGPGEFRDAFYLWALPGDTLWVGDYRPWQFLVFTPEGEWTRTVRPTPFYVNNPAVGVVLDDRRSVLAIRDASMPATTRFEPRHLTVVMHAPDGTMTDTLGTWENGRVGVMDNTPGAVQLAPLFESSARIAGGGNRILISHNSTPEIQVHQAGEQVALERIVRWTTGDRSITSEHIAAERRRLAEPFATEDPGLRERLLKPLVSEARPVADQFPAFGTLMSGRDGRIWIREFNRPGMTSPPRWTAFDAEGQVQCQATLPDVEQVYEIGADYLLALDPDEDDVPRVVLHRFLPARQ
jgi:hypothetical protein